LNNKLKKVIFKDLDRNFSLPVKQIPILENQDGITLSGGDPLFQLEAATEIAKYCKSKGLNIWCYTGFIIEELIKNCKICIQRWPRILHQL
jgi:organic radical activating enzyme